MKTWQTPKSRVLEMTTQILISGEHPKRKLKECLINYYVDNENMYKIFKQQLRNDELLLIFYLTCVQCLLICDENKIPIKVSLGENKIIELRKKKVPIKKSHSFLTSQIGRNYSNLHLSLLESQSDVQEDSPKSTRTSSEEFQEGALTF